jgi:hypothetical protein
MTSFKDFISSIFDSVNQLRTCPSSWVQHLENELSNYKQGNVRHRPGTVPLQTREGVTAVHELLDELRSIEELFPLDHSLGLSLAAQQHCSDTGSLGIVGHIGSRETTLQKRVEQFGKWSENIVEALDYGSVSAYEVVLSLLVDDGLPTRPHRNALLNPHFEKLGVGAAKHSEFKTVACLVFAVKFEDNEELPAMEFLDELIEPNPEVDDWLEGAVKLTCEVRDEYRGREKIQKIKKHWQMADGSIQTVEEEKVIPPEPRRQKSEAKKPEFSSIHEKKHTEEDPGFFVEVDTDFSKGVKVTVTDWPEGEKPHPSEAHGKTHTEENRPSHHPVEHHAEEHHHTKIDSREVEKHSKHSSKDSNHDS